MVLCPYKMQINIWMKNSHKIKMKQKNKFNTERIIYFLIGIVLILLAVLSVTSNFHLLKEPITEKEVKCYDKY